ncbi:amidohydrolase family protein [Tessaracoccus sp. MC1627]|uniref:amidohydrolase family protein n=1 Tax=Tessaracoccus sp. MC1627 TaxID=2760312 RepID=UPI001C724886|nr:amidohydrolase family protein [Tessaracoccus sp. MC1627]
MTITVVRAGRIFDGDRFHTGRDVVVDGKRIVAISDGTAYGQDVVLVDYGPDSTLLPGLIDTHQHVTWDCSTDPVTWLTTATDDELLVRARANARQALAGGTTTVRDLGDRGYVSLRLRAETAADPSAGPRLLASGPPLTSVGGHCWFLGGAVGGVDAIRAAVTERAERGCDVIKVMATGGNVTPGSLPHEAQFTRAELRALVETAHGFGLPVAAHGHGVEGIESALIAGVDTVEHASFMTADSVADRPDLVRRMVEAGVFAVGTAGSLPGGQLPPRLAAVLPLVLAHARRMHEAGVRIAVATDAGIAPSKPFNVQPYAVTEVARLLGLTPALRGATSIAADAIGLGDSIGRLRPGHTADLLVVDGNLEAGAEALHHVKAVYRSGELVGP